MEYRTPLGRFASWEDAAAACERADLDPTTCIEVVAPNFMAYDPSDGRRLRAATSDEAAAYLAQPARCSAFRKAIKVGPVLIDEDNGPGQWFGGAGF